MLIFYTDLSIPLQHPFVHILIDVPVEVDYLWHPTMVATEFDPPSGGAEITSVRTGYPGKNPLVPTVGTTECLSDLDEDIYDEICRRIEQYHYSLSASEPISDL